MNPVKNEAEGLETLHENDINHFNENQLLFVENENNCPLCDSKLEIKTRKAEQLYKVYEEAHCPCCKIKTRDKLYSMH